MRIALGILVTPLVSLGTGGGVRPQNDRPRATSSQSSPSAQPVCDIQDATDCRVSKGKKQFIWWEAPPDEARHVCFPTSAPFGTDHFDIRPGHHKSSGRIKGSPVTGTEFPYTTSADPCNQPHSKPRNSAKVIVED